MSNTRPVREVGYYIPPDSTRRYGPMPQDELVTRSEDVVIDRRGYIYITDKNRGLEILRYTGAQASSLPGRTANAARRFRSQGAATLAAKHCRSTPYSWSSSM
ncbi:hypothetical protein [Mycobacterium sp.]|uniref:hypothetical protein n=1 Tax=Mycobacterium sp. TaxID=1785 RepID=UPI003340B902